MESPENRPKGSLVVSFFSSRCDTVLFFLRIEKEKNGVAKFVSFSEGEKEMGAKNVSPLSLSEKESLTTSHH